MAAMPALSQHYSRQILFLLLPLLLICSLAGTCMATVYTVGDTAGWDISSDLASWPGNKTFYVGDALVFTYSSYHSLNEVRKEGHDNCSTSDAMMSAVDGNTTVPLTSAGDKYFICGVPLYCFGGMKLHVNVLQTTPVRPVGRPPLQQQQPPPSAGKAGGFYLSRAPLRGKPFGSVGWPSTVAAMNLFFLLIRPGFGITYF